MRSSYGVHFLKMRGHERRHLLNVWPTFLPCNLHKINNFIISGFDIFPHHIKLNNNKNTNLKLFSSNITCGQGFVVLNITSIFNKFQHILRGLSKEHPISVIVGQTRLQFNIKHYLRACTTSGKNLLICNRRYCIKMANGHVINFH